VLAFVALAFVVAAGLVGEYKPYSFLHGDGNFYRAINRSLVDGTLDQTRYQPMSWYWQDLGWNHNLDSGWSNVSLGADGKTPYPKHPLLLPILTTPVFWLFGDLGLLFANAGLLVAMLWSAFLIASRFAAPSSALGMAAIFACLPLFERGAHSYSNDVLYGFLVVAALERFMARRMVVAGLLLGLSMWAKSTNVLFCVPFGAILLWRRQWKDFAILAGVAFIPFGIHLVMNWAMFGGPLETAYQRILIREGGQPVIYDIANNFGRAFGEGVKSLWSDKWQGLDEYMSFGFIALLGLPLMLRKAPAFTTAFIVSLAGFVVLYAKYNFTYARFFTPWAALLVIPGAMLLDGTTGLVAAGIDKLGERIVGEKQRMVAGFLGGVAVLVAMVVLKLATADPYTWHAVDHVEFAKVEHVRSNRTVPCDFYNPRYAKMECSHIDGQPWHRWGRAIGKQCSFDKEPRSMLWLHPNPDATRTITFNDIPAGDLVVQYGLSEESRYDGLKFTVSSGKAYSRDLRVNGTNKLATVTIPAADRGGSVTITVPEQPYDWRQFCADIWVK